MKFTPTKPFKILIVEDDQTQGMILRALLSKSSLPITEVKSAESLATAFELLDNDHFDIMLLDLNLPDSDGLDTLTKTVNKYSSAAIVVITGESDENIGIEAIANGAQEYLMKGLYDIHALTKSIRYAVERKQAEKEKEYVEAQLRQAQKMEAIGTLAGGIAHDFNNMLGAMIGYSNLALKDIPENTLAHDNLKEILIAANRAKQLVQQILAFGREGEDNKTPLKIASMVREAVRTIKVSLPPNIEVHEEIEATHSVIMANVIHMHQILMNLCSNAIHAMGENGGMLGVLASDIDINSDTMVGNAFLKRGQYVRLTVSDTGCGMSRNVIERIFEPFFTTKEVDKGTGMGLYVVHGIIKNYGAAIGVESQEGKGTKFNVFFPKIGDEEAHTIEQLPIALEGGNNTILLVDDEAVMVDVTKQTLERLGYKVVGKTSGSEAIELFQTESDKFDLVVTDYRMPRITGTQLAKKLLAIRPDIPIILCTGFSEDIGPEEARSIGIKAYLTKPVTGKILAETIRTINSQIEVTT